MIQGFPLSFNPLPRRGEEITPELPKGLFTDGYTSIQI
jgi:hypothetical protein